MTTTDDDRTVEVLRRLAHDELPGGRLDPDLVLRAARRRRAARRAAGAAGAAVLALAIAIGVPAVVGTHRAAPPAGPTPTAGVGQEPRTFGDAPVVRLTDDVQAVNSPTRLDSGPLRIEDVGGSVVTIAAADGGVTIGVDGSGQPLTTRDPNLAMVGTSAEALTWRAGDRASDYDDTNGYRTLDGWYRETDGVVDEVVAYGSVPSWLPDPRVLLYSSGGFDLPEGGSASVVELPTFRAPTDDGRLLYLVVLRDAAARAFRDATNQVFFLGSDGSVFIPGCEGWATVGECEGQRGIALQQILAEPVATFSSSSTTASAGATDEPTGTATDEPTGGATSEPGSSGGPTSGTGPPVAIPAPVVLGPGLAASTGLSTRQAGTAADDGGELGPSYLVGDMNDASVRLGTGTEPLPWYRVLAVKDEAVSSNEVSGHTLFERATANSHVSYFGDPRDGLFEAGVTPSGAARAFHLSVTPVELADGATHRVFEIPTFAPPGDAAGRLDPDQRMYVLATERPAIDAFLDTTSRIVFATADGTIVDPGCGEEDLDACVPSFAEPGGAYDELRALLAAG